MESNDHPNISENGDVSNFDNEESSFVEFDEMSPDEIILTTFNNEPIWRSTSVVAPAPAPNAFEAFLESTPHFYSLERPSLLRGNRLNASLPSPSDTASEVGTVSTLSSPLTLAPDPTIALTNVASVPQIPVILMCTHFEMFLALDELILRVSNFLKTAIGVSFDFNSLGYQWVVYYLSGSCHCKLQISIYEGFREGYLIELHRLNGDSSLFRSLYLQIKADLIPSLDEISSAYDSFTVFTPLPCPPSILPYSDDLQGLGPIARMATSPLADSQLEAARTLCELSADEDMRVHLAALGFVDVLMQVFERSDSWWAQQHAMVALANLSDHTDCLPSLLPLAVLPMLNLLSTTDFESSHLRILAAYILANLCAAFASEVVQIASENVLRAWLSRVMCTDADDGLRLHSMRAWESLQLVM